MKFSSFFLFFIFITFSLVFTLSLATAEMVVGYDDGSDVPEVVLETPINYTEIISWVNNTLYWSLVRN